MKSSNQFPLYPHTLVTQKKSKIRIASRKIYIDASPEIYLFIVDAMKRINQNQQVNVEKEWNSYSERLSSTLMIGTKRIYSVRISTNWHSGKSHLVYKVDWDLLNRQLDRKTKGIVRELKKNPNVGLGLLYDTLAWNYVRASSVARRDNNRNLLRVKSGIRETEDWKILEVKVQLIHEVCMDLESRFPTNSFFEISKRLQKYTQELDFKGFLLTLRELLDRIFPLMMIKTFIIKTGNSPRLLVTSYFIYLNYLLEIGWRDKKGGRRRLNLDKQDIQKASDSFFRVINSFNLVMKDQSFDIGNLEKAFHSKTFSLPVFKTDAKSFTVLIKESMVLVKEMNGLQRLYEICSSSVHNILSLPFISLTEVKVVKEITDWYTQEFIKVLTAFEIVNKNLIDENAVKKNKFKWNLKPLVSYLESMNTSLLSTFNKLENISPPVDLKLLASFFNVYKPGISRLKNGSVNFSDFWNSLQEISLSSFNVGIELLYENLIVIGDRVKIELPSSKVLDDYKSEEIGFVASYLFLEYWST